MKTAIKIFLVLCVLVAMIGIGENLFNLFIGGGFRGGLVSNFVVLVGHLGALGLLGFLGYRIIKE